LLFLRTDVRGDLPERNMQETHEKNLFFLDILKAAERKEQDPDQNPVYGSEEPDP
jgi:hypothetical protein